MPLALPFAFALLLGAACLAALASPLPFLAPLLILGLAGMIALYRWPAWGLLGILVFVPLEGLFSNTGGFTLNKLLGLALILLVSLQLLLGKLRREHLRSNLWPLVGALLFWYLLSLAFSVHLGLSLLELRQLLVGVALFVLTVVLCRSFDLMLLAKLVSLSVAGACLVGVLTAAEQLNGRATGLLTDPNYFALLITFAFPLALLSLLRSPGLLRRLFWLGVLVLLLAGLGKTGSRSGLMVLLLTCALSVWHYRDSLKTLVPRHLGWLVLGLAITLPLLPSLLPDDFKQRLTALASLGSRVTIQTDTSLARRASYLLVGKEIIKEHPLLGSGPGTYPLEFAKTGYAIAFAHRPDVTQLYREAHNTYLSMFSELGVPGGLLFLALVFVALRNFHRARSRWLERGDTEQAALATHLGLAFTVLALFMLFLTIPSHKYLWVMLGVASHLYRQAHEPEVREELS
ncbi:O-antigen ligase family protein [Pseudomonas resinovorans]|uniref:O-antigen ligase family protein n=1 Tax=Metapseudomonas resinovorans TaxID=53412 RepID=UPI00237F0D59|nr:O-antigen ligase family protein [Pseudomonas resinovorans]MDE3739160.1 O-antigen ligase family protein [Pseudomonas resinovorans]